jgi:monoamine oxidase
MARSALINLFHRAYRIARISTKYDIPSSDAEAWLNRRISRRQTLQSGAVLIGALGLPANQSSAIPPVSFANALADAPTAAPSTAKVLIVGAGIAGLTAAYRLLQAGVSVDVVESSYRVGGRLVSFSHLSDIVGTVELGGEFIDTRHRAVRSLATELGLKLMDLRAADAGLEPEILYFRGSKLSHNQVVEDFSPLAARITADLQQLNGRDTTYHFASPAARKLDRLSLAEYLEKAAVDPVINQLVKAAYVTEFGLDAEEQTCLNMLFLIGKQVGQWSTYGVSDERWHVLGGNDRISQTLADKVGDRIEFGMNLESIRSTPNGRYRVSFRQVSNSIERIYERILLTMPFSALRYIELAVDLPPVKQKAIAELGYGTCSKLATPYQEKIWRDRYRSTISIYTDLDFQNTWESARYSSGPGGWVTNLRGGKQGIALGRDYPDTHAQQLTQDLEGIFPGISTINRGASLRFDWASNPYSLGSYSCYKPGQWTQFGGAEAERVGNLWFAGEHCALESQGYMNGACETAELAALSILEDLGLSANAAQQRARIETFAI